MKFFTVSATTEGTYRALLLASFWTALYNCHCKLVDLSTAHHCCMHLQGVSTSRSQAGTASDSDVRYPTLHKPAAHHGNKQTPNTAAAAADPDNPEVQYPGIYKPNKKTDASKVCRHNLAGIYLGFLTFTWATDHDFLCLSHIFCAYHTFLFAGVGLQSLIFYGHTLYMLQTLLDLEICRATYT